MFDFIFILGPDCNGKPFIEKLTEFKNADKKVAIVTKSSDYESLAAGIGPDTRIDIYAHGFMGMNEQEYFLQLFPFPGLPEFAFVQNKYIATHRIFSYLASQFVAGNGLNRLQVHLWSCFSGRGIYAVTALPFGATLITHAPEHMFTSNTFINDHAVSSLSRQSVDPFSEFNYVLSEESVNEPAIAQLRKNGVFIYRALSAEDVLISPDDVISEINEKRVAYQDALQAVIDPAETTALTEVIRLSDDKVAKYESEMVYNHAFFSPDTTYVRRYFERKKSHPENFLYRQDNLLSIAAMRMDNKHNLPDLWDYILESRMNVCVSTQADFKAFHVFINHNNLEGVNFLLSKNFDVNHNGQLGRTPLMQATFQRRIAIVKRLLQQKNTLINAQDEEGYSALHIAAYLGDLEILESLLHAGADPMLCSKAGNTPLYLAAEKGFVSVVDRLLRDSKGILALNVDGNDGITPIWSAASGGHLDVVKLLLEYQADITATDHNDGLTPFTAALKYNYTDVALLLSQRERQHTDVARLFLSPVVVKSTQDVWLCEARSNDALHCMKNNTMRYLTKLPNTASAWDVLAKEGDAFVCTTLPHHQGQHCVGQKVEYREWSLQSELKTAAPGLLMTLTQSALSGVAATALPEAIGDLLLWLDILTEANSQHLKRVITAVLMIMTGSWLSASTAIILSQLLHMAGCSETFSKATGNSMAHCVAVGFEVRPLNVFSGLFNYTAGRLGLFLEKRGMHKLREITQNCIEIDTLVIDL